MRAQLTFVVAALGAWAATLAATAIGRRLALRPRGETRAFVEERRVPRIGGAALAVAFAVAVFVASRVGDMVGLGDRPLLLAGAALAFAAGFIDDLVPLPAQLKLGALVGAGLLVARAGLLIERLPIVDVSLPPVAAWIVTVAFVAAVVTAWNFIDGLDGLAAGITAVVAIAFWTLGARDGVAEETAPALAGVALGFLALNRPPARIFMGDGGSFFIGYFIAVLAIQHGDGGRALPGAMVLVVLAWPLGDLAWAIVRRARRRALFSASADHLHYALSARIGSRRAMLVALLVTALAGTVALSMLASFGVRALALSATVLVVPLFCGRFALARRLGVALALLIALQAVATTWPARHRVARDAAVVVGSAEHTAAYRYQYQ